MTAQIDHRGGRDPCICQFKREACQCHRHDSKVFVCLSQPASCN